MVVPTRPGGKLTPYLVVAREKPEIFFEDEKGPQKPEKSLC
jgi:hypothetical protein